MALQTITSMSSQELFNNLVNIVVLGILGKYIYDHFFKKGSIVDSEVCARERRNCIVLRDLRVEKEVLECHTCKEVMMDNLREIKTNHDNSSAQVLQEVKELARCFKEETKERRHLLTVMATGLLGICKELNAEDCDALKEFLGTKGIV